MTRINYLTDAQYQRLMANAVANSIAFGMALQHEISINPETRIDHSGMYDCVREVAGTISTYEHDYLERYKVNLFEDFDYTSLIDDLAAVVYKQIVERQTIVPDVTAATIRKLLQNQNTTKGEESV